MQQKFKKFNIIAFWNVAEKESGSHRIRISPNIGEPNHFMRIRHSSAPTVKQAKLLEQTDAVNFVTFSNPIIIIPVYLCITSRVNGAGAA
jgi:hypothetical protein